MRDSNEIEHCDVTEVRLLGTFHNIQELPVGRISDEVMMLFVPRSRDVCY
jgi:hypothetical protein